MIHNQNIYPLPAWYIHALCIPLHTSKNFKGKDTHISMSIFPLSNLVRRSMNNWIWANRQFNLGAFSPPMNVLSYRTANGISLMLEVVCQ